MLKILQARLQQYVNHELPYVHAEFRKDRGPRDQIVNTKAFDCVDHNKLWTILREMGIPGHLTCLLKNLYAGQQAAVKTGHGTIFWFQIERGVCQC